MCSLTTIRTQHLVTPRRRTRTTRLQLLTRRDAGQALKAAVTTPALAGPGPGRDAEPLKVTK
jgi:hypothetical protein